MQNNKIYLNKYKTNEFSHIVFLLLKKMRCLWVSNIRLELKIYKANILYVTGKIIALLAKKMPTIIKNIFSIISCKI